MSEYDKPHKEQTLDCERSIKFKNLFLEWAAPIVKSHDSPHLSKICHCEVCTQWAKYINLELFEKFLKDDE